MSVKYAYKYATIDLKLNGLCRGVADTTDYILSRDHVPIEDDTLNYALKYYHPIPEVVNSHDDFQGKWYTDAAHTNEWIPSKD